jgi:hypothetical protein
MAAFVFAVGEPMVQSISMESMPSVLSTGMMHNSGASAVSNYPNILNQASTPSNLHILHLILNRGNEHAK